MCGICGVAFSDPDRTLDPSVLRAMADTLRHRGPDSDGYLCEPGIALGFRRLSIVDLETGDQPIFSEDGRVAIICNGEIYNAPELRADLEMRGHRFSTHSDVEVIVHLYEEHGPACVEHLRGMFAFALWDATSRQLMLARDRFGIKPAYYAETASGLWFASEMKALFAGGEVRPVVDPLGVRDMLVVGYAVAPRTMATGVLRLPPAHYVVYRDGRASVHRYWRLSFPPAGAYDRRTTERQWAEAVREKLRECVRMHLRSDVPVGAWLSGGLDSSAVVSLIGYETGELPDTFMLAFENPDVDEVTEQRVLSDFPGYTRSNTRIRIGHEHFRTYPRTVYQVENVSSGGIEVVQMALARASAERFKVVLTGEGSDEVFGGYAWFRTEKALRPLSRLPLRWRQFLAAGPAMLGRLPGLRRMLMAPMEPSFQRYRTLVGYQPSSYAFALASEDVRRAIDSAGALPDVDARRPADFDRWHPFAQLKYYEFAVRMPNAILRNLEHTSMAFSLEARVPFLDHELVELAARIPPDIMLRGMREKNVLREAMRGLLPGEIRSRRKRGLRAPFRDWMGDGMPDFAREMLSHQSLRDKGYFSPRAIARLVDGHGEATPARAYYLMVVLSVQLWDEIFVGGWVPPETV
jgi:asparagine synthase (glutamine-hydrolysing)